MHAGLGASQGHAGSGCKALRLRPSLISAACTSGPSAVRYLWAQHGNAALSGEHSEHSCRRVIPVLVRRCMSDLALGCKQDGKPGGDCGDVCANCGRGAHKTWTDCRLVILPEASLTSNLWSLARPASIACVQQRCTVRYGFVDHHQSSKDASNRMR